MARGPPGHPRARVGGLAPRSAAPPVPTFGGRRASVGVAAGGVNSWPRRLCVRANPWRPRLLSTLRSTPSPARRPPSRSPLTAPVPGTT
eukprot:83285-Alexandrium_andersonii.AAC.1